MNRRSAIRNVVIISAGASFLPSCLQGDKNVYPLKNISISGSQQDMLSALADAIIPKTSGFIGARDLKAHEFVLTMIDDCTSPEDQKKFTDGLTAFDQLSHDRFGEKFKSFTPEQKHQLLADIESKKNITENVLSFYGTVKRYTLQSFISSEQYMVGIKKYKMVPGPIYKGCIPVS